MSSELFRELTVYRGSGPTIAVTYNDDRTLQEVCQALAPKLQDTMLSYVLIATVPRCSWVSRLVEFFEQVIFKALTVLHTMIRDFHTDDILNCITSLDTLRLRQVATGERHSECVSDHTSHGSYLTQPLLTGYPLAENLSHYTSYLETRAHSYTFSRTELLLTRTRKLFMDSLEDGLTLNALSFLVKDLLVLFSAENKGDQRPRSA